MRFRLAIAALLSAILALGLTSCSSSGGSNSTSSSTSSSASSTGGGATTSSSAAGSTSAAPTGSTYTIGAIETEGVPPINNNNDISGTMTAWSNYVNSHGGINGHPVSVKMENDSGDPAKSLTAFHTLANAHVLAIIDNTSLDTSWASAAQSAGIPVICGAQLARGFSCNENPDFFPAGGTIGASFYGSFVAGKAAGAKTLGDVYCTEVAACKQGVNVVKQSATQAGLTFSTALAASLSAASYAPQCLVLKNKNIDSVQLGGPTYPKFAADCAQQGYKPTYLAADFSWQTSMLATSALDGTTGATTNVPWMLTNTPALTEFHSAVGDLLDKSFSPYNVSTTWAGCLLFAAAAQKAGDNPTPASIVSGLYALHGETLGGFSPPLTFTRGKDHYVPYFYEISVKSGKFVTPNNGVVSRWPQGQAS